MKKEEIKKIIEIREKTGCGMIDAKNVYIFCDGDVKLACAYLKELFFGNGYCQPRTNKEIKECARRKWMRND